MPEIFSCRNAGMLCPDQSIGMTETSRDGRESGLIWEIPVKLRKGFRK